MSSEGIEVHNDDLDEWLKKVSTYEEGSRKLEKNHRELKTFLTRLQENLSSSKNVLKLTGILKKFPKLGQSLGRLCDCKDIVFDDELYGLLIQCVLLLSDRNPTLALEQKATSWAQTQVRKTASYYKQEDPCSIVAQTTGCYPDHYNSQSCGKLIEAINGRLKHLPHQAWDNKTGLILPCRPLPSDTLSKLSLQCLPLLKVSSANQVIEALVSCQTSTNVREPLHPAFLEAVMESLCNNAYSDVPSGIILSYDCHVALWIRYLPALEKEVVILVEELVSRQPWLTRERASKLINTRHLPAACLKHPAIYRVVDNIFQAFLENTQGNTHILQIMDYFNQALLQCIDDASKTLPGICSLYPLKYRCLVNLLITPPQGLSIQSCCLHLSNIDNILSEISFHNYKPAMYDLWLVLVKWPTWYYKAIEVLLMSSWNNKPPGINIICWFNYPLNSDKHIVFKETLISLVGILQQLINQSNLELENLKHTILANQTSDCSQLTNVLQPMFQLFVMHSEVGLQKLPHIMALTLPSDAIITPVCQLKFVLDAIELFGHLDGSVQTMSNRKLLVKIIQDLKNKSLADLLARGDGNRLAAKQETDHILLHCSDAESYLEARN